MQKIILASSSPRRKEILNNIGLDFEVFKADCDESIPDELVKTEAPAFLAEKKSLCVYTALPAEKKEKLILAADTMIHFNGKLYGKPKNKAEAFHFLYDFQGNSHDVITGIALLNGKTGKIIKKSITTKIFFKTMSKDEIELYLSKNEWQDAAGAYKIQGFASCFIEKIEGSYSNVVGLPISSVYDILKGQGFSFS